MCKQDIDVYFLRQYAECYCDIENAEVCEYEYKCAYGDVYYIFLKRKIKSERNPGYYDITTPYGYGGPVILDCVLENRDALVYEFSKDFTTYCYSNNIICEFIRFHPIIKNHIDFKQFYYPVYNRKTVCIDLSSEDVMSAISSTCRNRIRKAEGYGVEVDFDFSGERLDEFHKLYTLTMEKNLASSFYFFNKHFFDFSAKSLPNNCFFIHALWEGRIISSVMFLYSEKYIHYHFPSTHPDFYHLSANDLIIYSVIKWGIAQGKDKIHLGGGRTNLENDTLLAFKKKFSKGALSDFYVGKKVYNQKIYNEMCLERHISSDEQYFPAYRVT